MLQLDPADPDACDILQVSRKMAKRDMEADEVARAHFEKFPTARNHYRHAASLFSTGQEKDAEKILRTGLKKYPDDVTCLLGLAAVLMATSDKSEVLAEADQLLDQAKRLVTPGSLFVDHDFLRAILGGLAPLQWTCTFALSR
jgi:hypothetical protein